ncbi:MAG: L-fucose/L-arabinose isomerase family protein [Sedimentisphaerales bacterium]
MKKGTSAFALFFGNRSFFPSSLMAEAREELSQVFKKMGHEVLMMPTDATRYGAVETAKEGHIYAKWLEEHKGKFDGIILCLPNFGDETGAVVALKDAGVPIFVQAYPDEADKMSPASRRDAFCGKFSITDVLCQYDVPFTAIPPHAVAPSSPQFKENIDYFDRVCRVVSGLKGMTVGAIGARTTAFKTVRIDELALQSHGITTEVFDMSDVFARMRAVSSGKVYKAKADQLKKLSSWKDVPQKNFDNIVKLWVVLGDLIEEYQLDALALRCWIELQKEMEIAACGLIGLMNDVDRPIACEMDIGNAIAMYAISLASGKPAGVLDWNNNYNNDDNKCILFHCGSMPPSMMVAKGKIVDNIFLAKVVGKNHSLGCNIGRIAPTDMTFGSLTTKCGRIKCYLGEGAFTDDPISKDFFGCAGVAEIPNLQKVLLHVAYNGHRHHVSVTSGHCKDAVAEAMTRYLGFEVAIPQKSRGCL